MLNSKYSHDYVIYFYCFIYKSQEIQIAKFTSQRPLKSFQNNEKIYNLVFNNLSANPPLIE